MWLRTGRALRIIGAAAAAVVMSAVGLGTGVAYATPPAYGQQSALVLRVTWPGADGSGSTDLDTTITGGVNPWMHAASRNIFNGFTVTDPGLLTITKPALSAPPNQCDNAFLHSMEVSAEQAAGNRGLSINNFNVVVYWFPFQSACPWSGNGDLGGLRVHLNGNISQVVLIHELGHHLGLSHGHVLYCRDGAGNDVPLSTNCTSGEYGDFVNEMGTGQGTYSALQLNDIHWLDGMFATVPPDGGGYLVSPLDSMPPGTGIHALRIPDGAETIWVEYRQPSSLDSFDPDQGVFIHLQRPDGSVSAGSYLLRMSTSRSQLAVGASWANPLGHMRIAVDYGNSQAAHITVTTNQIHVPNLQYLDVNSAAGLLNSVGLTLGHQTSVNNCLDPGDVTDQNPSAGTMVDPGTSVAVGVSTCTGNGGGGAGGGDGNPREPK